jgi:hypothetical protein
VVACTEDGTTEVVHQERVWWPHSREQVRPVAFERMQRTRSSGGVSRCSGVARTARGWNHLHSPYIASWQATGAGDAVQAQRCDFSVEIQVKM